MNQNINTTLAALIPVLRMNGENVVSIEAVHDWYKGQYKDANGRPREYMKEVAEITYESGGVKYADIGCDSNLTACYDVIAVIQQTKPQSAVIERIERGVYPAAQPKERTEKRTETHACELIDRQAAIDAICTEGTRLERNGTVAMAEIKQWCVDILEALPSAQPEQRWIPCSERLPRQGQEVICQCRANMIKVLKLDACGDWYQDAEHCYMSGFVIAWMPLPEPYRAKRRTDETD